MEIIKNKDGDELTLCVEGRIDASTAKEFEDVVMSSIDGVKTLVFDFGKLDYTSSAGLRVLLKSQKRMDAQGGDMIIRKPNEVVIEILEETGFINIFEVEE
jgi:anti-anti-sigma factor